MLTLGLDIGTTTISSVVFDKTNQKVIESKTIKNDSFIQTSHAWERIQDPAVILNQSLTLIDELLKRYPQVESIGLTGQMHGIVYLNADGCAVSPLYTWQYGGGAELLTEMQDENVHTGYGMVTYFYHYRNEMVPEDAVVLCTIMDYLGVVLTGRKRPLMHISNAAGMGLFDGENGWFQLEKIEKLGMNPDMLPEVSAAFEMLGTYHGIPVKVAIGDNQASFLGAVGMQEGAVLLNMGTGGQISMMTERYVMVPGIETRPLAKGKYLLVGASLCGGRAYAVLENFFRTYMKAAGAGEKVQYEAMEQLAGRGQELWKHSQKFPSPAAETNMIQVCTAFCGTRQNPSLRGSITGISEDNFTPENLVYGVLRGMVQELYGMYEQIVKAGCDRADILVASGNGLRKNRVLQEISSEMFGAELVLSQYEEEAACGAARI